MAKKPNVIIAAHRFHQRRIIDHDARQLAVQYYHDPRGRGLAHNAKHHSQQKLAAYPYPLAAQHLSLPTTRQSGIPPKDVRLLLTAVLRVEHPNAHPVTQRQASHIMRHLGWYTSRVWRWGVGTTTRTPVRAASSKQLVTLWFPPEAIVRKGYVD